MCHSYFMHMQFHHRDDLGDISSCKHIYIYATCTLYGASPGPVHSNVNAMQGSLGRQGFGSDTLLCRAKKGNLSHGPGSCNL